MLAIVDGDPFASAASLFAELLEEVAEEAAASSAASDISGDGEDEPQALSSFVSCTSLIECPTSLVSGSWAFRPVLFEQGC